MWPLSPISPPVAAAGLAWMAALWMTPRYLRHRRDIRLCLYWRAVVLFALALTFVVPVVYDTVNRVVGTPNAARWMADALVLTGTYMFDTFYFALAHARDRLRWHRPWLLAGLVLALAMMALLLWQVNLPADPLMLDVPRLQPAAVAYRVIFLVVFGFFLVRLMRHTVQYQRDTHHPLVKINMTLTVGASVWAVGYLGVSSIALLVPAASPLAWFMQDGVQVCLLFMVLLLVLGVTVPWWGRWLGIVVVVRQVQMLLTYWRLQPLWRQLTWARPQVALPIATAWPAALWRPQQLELLLHRQVIEILDARWLLLTAIPATTAPESQLSMTDQRRQSTEWHPSTDGSAPVKASSRPSATTTLPPHRSLVLPGASHQESRSERSGTRLDRTRTKQLVEAEARALARVLQDVPSGKEIVPPDFEMYQPATCGDAVRYLERLAVALHAEMRRHRRCIASARVRSAQPRARVPQ